MCVGPFDAALVSFKYLRNCRFISEMDLNFFQQADQCDFYTKSQRVVRLLYCDCCHMMSTDDMRLRGNDKQWQLLVERGGLM